MRSSARLARMRVRCQRDACYSYYLARVALCNDLRDRISLEDLGTLLHATNLCRARDEIVYLIKRYLSHLNVTVL